MATGDSGRNSSQPRRGDAKNAAHNDARNAKKPKQHRRRRWLLPPIVLILAVWLLPVLIVHTPLLNWIVAKSTADLNGTLRVGSASAGWFSPIIVENIEMRDARGQNVLTVPSAHNDRSLAALLWNFPNLGRFTIERPSASILLRENGSNLEDMLAKYLEPTEEKTSSTTVGLAVEIIDASISVTEELTGQTWRIERFGASLDMPNGPEGPLTGRISADLSGGRGGGKLSAEVQMASGRGEAAMLAEQLPLEMFRPLAARLVPGMKIAGRASSTARATWGGADGKLGAQLEFKAEEFAFAAPFLQGDVVRLDRLHAVSLASWNEGRLNVEKTLVDCDLGDLNCESTLKLDHPDGLTLRGLLRERHELGGRVDVARLAAMLPATLHLRDRAKIDSGEVRLALSSRPGPQGMTWEGQLKSNGLSGTTATGPVAWNQPILVDLKARETSDGPVVESLNCESDFLKIHAHGTPDALAASMTFSLGLLADRLGQFFDLGGMQLAGQGLGNLQWNRNKQQQFTADADLRLTNFQLGLPERLPWRENDLTATLSAKGRTNGLEATRIETAVLRVNAGADQIDVQLAQPVENLQDGGAWPLRGKGQGQLQSWPGRLAAWLPAGAWRISGPYQLDADCTASKDRMEVRQARLAATPLFAAGGWQIAGQVQGTGQGQRVGGAILGASTFDAANLTIVDPAGRRYQEPQVRLAARAQYAESTGALQIEQCELASAALAVKGGGRVAQVNGENQGQFDAQLNYDLERLAWLAQPWIGSGWLIAGQGSSTATYRGPFALATGTGAANLRWDSIRVLGAQLGPGELKAGMAQGIAGIEPIELAASQGRIRLAPQARLAPGPMELHMPAGPLAQHIQVDPAMCGSALKYIAPVLADVSTARGAFSIDLDGCRIPLADPAKGDIAGRFTIHSIEVGPGPLTAEMATFLGRAAPAKLKQESVVEFRMVDGRVHHRGLELIFPDFTMRTAGSVGLDQTLNITVEMPVPPKWQAGNTTLAQAMRNQTITVPLAGTLSKPRLDQRVVDNYTRQFLQRAASNVIESELNRLLTPKK